MLKEKPTPKLVRSCGWKKLLWKRKK